MPQRKSKYGLPRLGKERTVRRTVCPRQEVCEYLGISISTLMKLRKSGLPTYQVGGQKRFRISEVNEFIGKYGKEG